MFTLNPLTKFPPCETELVCTKKLQCDLNLFLFYLPASTSLSNIVVSLTCTAVRPSTINGSQWNLYGCSYHCFSPSFNYFGKPILIFHSVSNISTIMAYNFGCFVSSSAGLSKKYSATTAKNSALLV